jgi:hypothetical protein
MPMRSPRDKNDWLFLAVFFLGFCALVAALGPARIDFGGRYLRAFVAFGSGVAAMAITVVFSARFGGAVFAVGWFVGIFLSAPLVVSLAMRFVP